MPAGDNRITWPNGCCEGDLIIIDFRDEQGDGNDGQGTLSINGSTGPQKHVITNSVGFTWKTHGPYCAPQGWHNFTYTSDQNYVETTFTIRDSYGLIKAQGGMDAFPVRFYTMSPSKFCTPSGGVFSQEEQKKRNRKLLCYHDQFTPRATLEAEGYGVCQDDYPPLTVYNNSGGQMPAHGPAHGSVVQS